MPEDNIPTETIAETESYQAWASQEPDGETVFHLEMGQVTLHFFKEEWDEFLQLIEAIRKSTNGK